jgi:hypothetical protein
MMAVMRQLRKSAIRIPKSEIEVIRNWNVPAYCDIVST